MASILCGQVAWGGLKLTLASHASARPGLQPIESQVNINSLWLLQWELWSSVPDSHGILLYAPLIRPPRSLWKPCSFGLNSPTHQSETWNPKAWHPPTLKRPVAQVPASQPAPCLNFPPPGPARHASYHLLWVVNLSFTFPCGRLLSLAIAHPRALLNWR